MELDVYPEGNMSIYEDGLAADWTVESAQAESNLHASEFSHSGHFSHAISLNGGYVKYVFRDYAGIDAFGYSHLQCYINGGMSSGQDPKIALHKLSDLGVVPQEDTWTLVTVPITEPLLTEDGRLIRILISGTVEETFYLDDMELIAATPQPTAAVESGETILPSGYVLSQNFPNPFNPQTTIRYDLPEAGNVRLVVYNPVGQRIRTLVDERQSKGIYATVWDGRDDIGRDVASGVYVYSLWTDRKSEMRRMVLIR
jgi:hypothetical protein